MEELEWFPGSMLSPIWEKCSGRILTGRFWYLCSGIFFTGGGTKSRKKKELWYSCSFEVPVLENKNVLLHFGAVDWKADIWVNDEGW